MFEALLDADSCGHGVLEGVEPEAEGGVVVEDLIEELPALLDLEVVAPVHGPLVDGAPSVQLLGLALTARYEDVKSEHIVDCEFLSIDSLLEGLLVDDDLVAVDQVLLELVGKNTFQRSHLIGV